MSQSEESAVQGAASDENIVLENPENPRAGSRVRVPTEKGLHYQISMVGKRLKDAVSKWRKSVSNMSIVLSDTRDICKIRDNRDKLVEAMTLVQDTFEYLKDTEENSHVRDSSYDEFASLLESVELEHQNFMCKISERISDLEIDRSESKSTRSHKSNRYGMSVASHCSSRSDAAVEAAALKIRLKYIDSELRSKAELERVKTQRDLEIAEAKLENFKEVGDDDNSIKPMHLKNETEEYTREYVNAHFNTQMPLGPVSLPFEAPHIPNTNTTHTKGLIDPGPVTSALDPNVQSFIPPNPQGGNLQTHSNGSHENCNQQMVELTASLLQQMNLSRLPPPEPSVFDGDPLKYPSWKSSFSTLIEQKQIPATEKIHYLRKYLSLQVREVVENYFLLTSDDAYEAAKGLLEQRFGDPFIIGDAFRNKLEKWPRIQARDSKGLQRFADFLNQCSSAMEGINCLAVLDDCRQNRKLLQKLPEWMINRWNRLTSQWKIENGSYPPFKEFARFVTAEAKLACDPITSLMSLKPDQSTEERVGGRNRTSQVKGRSFLTEVDTESNVTEKCNFCQKDHDIEQCKDFLAKSFDNRKAFARENKLCFACLGKSHVAKGCRSRKKCSICGKLHPTPLHENKPPGQGTIVNMQNKAKGHEGSIKASSHFIGALSTNPCLSSMIVPVYVSHRDFPEKERLIYALLDSQSDTTFILDSTCRSLDVSGVEVDLLLSTMHAENLAVKSKRVEGLIVRGCNQSTKIQLPVSYTRQIMPANRSHIPTTETAMSLNHLKCIADEFMPLLDCEIGLLIGYNCSRALMPREIIASEANDAFAQRTDLGWGIVGVVDDGSGCLNLDPVGVSHQVVACNINSSLSAAKESSEKPNKIFLSLKNKVKEVINPNDIVKMMNLDFIEHTGSGVGLSIEDKQFLELVSNGLTKNEGHYEMPLPLKDCNMQLPCNKSMATRRLISLRKRLQSDKRYCDHYCGFMRDILENGHAEKVPASSSNRSDGRVWYIPHHGIYHPKKPDKIRVVFDCSATFGGESLNNHLLQGPDLTNKLIGVLCRFRKEQIAIVCDIEKMFFQFKVKPEHRDLLRFLWWESEDFSKEPVEYRMCVHLFGAASSPGCANFGLKQTALDGEKEFGLDVANFVRDNFYVDDGLISVPSEAEAVSLIRRSTEMCKMSGLRLHKFLSNSKAVIRSIPFEDRAKVLVNVDLLNHPLPVERALGVQWCVESDSFQFRIILSDSPLTRRGILSTVSSVYDPLGLIAPVVLVGKQLLQQLCADQKGWDDPISDLIASKWEKWRSSLLSLGSIKLRRCFKAQNGLSVVKRELHHFSDASMSGYGQCSYLRVIDEQNQVYCSLVMGKSRVVPLKPVTIPRLELTAALVSVKISDLVQQELGYKDIVQWYWTDSKIVMGYIANDSRRFQVYVANRVQQIRELTYPKQWRHVDSDKNPADIASRGVFGDEFVNNPIWLNGPSFLWDLELPKFEDGFCVPSDDCELKRVHVFETQVCEVNFPSLLETFKTFSSWLKLKRVIALCIKFFRKLRFLRNKTSVKHPESVMLKVPLSVADLIDAESRIVRIVQFEAFEREINLLQHFGQRVRPEPDCKVVSKQRKVYLKGQSIYKLDPFLDANGILRVGGRLSRMHVNQSIKHPIILPRKCHITDLIVRFFHERVCHQGRGITSNEIRANGFWIIGLSAAVYRCISCCVMCRRLRFSPIGQKMANLPVDRIEPSPPFTYTGVDYFGPWYIREGRKELKRYGVVFTCLCCRAVHLETAAALSTDSFINALRRFISIRGPIRELRSDRGTNFVGAERELKEALSEMEECKIRQFLLNEGADFIFNTNVPHASHMGGIWERQIRSVRNILAELMFQHGQQLDDESLRTFMCESAAILNSRPLTCQNLNDPMSLEPLTPNHLLTMKSKIILPPPGHFQKQDLYSRKRWRRIQYLSNEFWLRWQKEYLQNLQLRNKWHHPKRNFIVGDVVLLVEESLPRSQWHLGRIVEAFPGQDKLVRKVRVMVGNKALDSKGKRKETDVQHLDRPIHKLVLLKESDL